MLDLVEPGTEVTQRRTVVESFPETNISVSKPPLNLLNVSPIREAAVPVPIPELSRAHSRPLQHRDVAGEQSTF